MASDDTQSISTRQLGVASGEKDKSLTDILNELLAKGPQIVWREPAPASRRLPGFVGLWIRPAGGATCPPCDHELLEARLFWPQSNDIVPGALHLVADGEAKTRWTAYWETDQRSVRVDSPVRVDLESTRPDSTVRVDLESTPPHTSVPVDLQSTRSASARQKTPAPNWLPGLSAAEAWLACFDHATSSVLTLSDLDRYGLDAKQCGGQKTQLTAHEYRDGLSLAFWRLESSNRKSAIENRK